MLELILLLLFGQISVLRSYKTGPDPINVRQLTECSKIDQVDARSDSKLLITCPDKLYIIDKKNFETSQIDLPSKEEKTEGIEPRFGCAGKVSEKNFCSTTLDNYDNIDFTHDNCVLKSYQSSLLIHHEPRSVRSNAKIIICSSSQKLLLKKDSETCSKVDGSKDDGKSCRLQGFCQLFDINGTPISLPCDDNQNIKKFIDPRQFVTAGDQSIGEIVYIPIQSRKNKARSNNPMVMVLNNYKDKPTNDLTAISLHQLETNDRKCEAESCPAIRIFNHRLTFATSWTIEEEKMILKFGDKAIRPPQFKFIRAITNSDGTDGVLIVYSLDRQVIVGHMCTDLDGLGTLLRDRPWFIFYTYRDLVLNNINGDISAVDIVESDGNNWLFISTRDGNIYTYSVNKLEEKILDAISQTDCSKAYDSDFVPWSANYKDSNGQKFADKFCGRNGGKKTTKRPPGICSGRDERQDELVQLWGSRVWSTLDMRSTLDEDIPPLLRLKTNSRDLKNRPVLLANIGSEPTSVKVIETESKKHLIILATDADSVLHKIHWDKTYEISSDQPRGKEYFTSEPYNHPIKILDANKKYCYLSEEPTNREPSISKLDVPNCSSYESCSECLGEGSDPQCQWCLESGSCKVKCDGPKSSSSPDSAIVVETVGYCPKIDQSEYSGLTPCDQFLSESCLNAKNWNMPLRVYGMNQIAKNENFICVWTIDNKRCYGPKPMTFSNKPERKIEFICIPSSIVRAGAPCDVNSDCNPKCSSSSVDGKVEINVGIALQSKTAEPRPFVETRKYFINCEELKSCGSCLQYTGSECQWCHSDNTCYSGMGKCAHVDSVSTKKEECPYFQIDKSYIHYASKLTQLRFQLKNLKADFVEDLKDGKMFKQNILNFVCKLTIGGELGTVKEIIQTGKLEGDEIVCSIDQQSEYSIFHKPKVNVNRIDWSTDLEMIKAEYEIKIGLNATLEEKQSRTKREVRIDPDNDQDIIRVFDCPSDYGCDDCLSLPSEYNCNFCRQSKSSGKSPACTTTASKCVGTIFGSNNDQCHEPDIVEIEPNSATLSGTTIIKVTGRNFNKPEDFNILIGQEKCIYLNSFTLPDNFDIIKNYRHAFYCKFEGKNLKNNQLSFLEIQGAGDKYDRRRDFRLAEPTVNEIKPSKIISLGGATISLIGQDLDVGRDENVEIILESSGIKYKCIVEKPRLPKIIECKLQTIETPAKNDEIRVSLTIDGSDELVHSTDQTKMSFVSLGDDNNKFKLDPNGPEGSNQLTLYSVVHGGSLIEIFGTHMDLLPSDTKIRVRGIEGNCGVTKLTEPRNSLDCNAPNITEIGTFEFEIRYPGYEDTIESNLDKMSIAYLSGPMIEHKNEHRIEDQEHWTKYGLKIEGSDFCLGQFIKSGSKSTTNQSEETEECGPIIKKWVDNGYYKLMLSNLENETDIVACSKNEFKVENSELLCNSDRTLFQNQPYRVEVVIGNWVGVAIDEMTIKTDLKMILVLSVLAFLVVVIIVSVVFLRKRHFDRMSQEERKQEERRLMMKNEKNELEHGMKELVRTLNAGPQTVGGTHGDSPFHTLPSDASANFSLPFRNYQTFVLRVMFPPGSKDCDDWHQMLQPTGTFNSRHGTIERNSQMNKFLSVLGQREFLIPFVKTLEAQPNFTMTDRNNVAAFIMIALQDRLDYATVVLQYLMVEMIDNCRDDQLMTLMRSSGTICEKMLSFWFAMLMHRTLFERTGNYIYRLFEAVKSWTYNQPVDEVTGHAKGTLAEQYLLRIFPNETKLILKVRHTEAGDAEHITEVHCLYCDTIDQVKTKTIENLYKNTPFSNRPQIQDYDLEYHDPGNLELNKTRRVMRNIDQTSVIEGQFRRLNTIEHYTKQFHGNSKRDFIPSNSQAYVKLCQKPFSNLGNSHSSTIPRNNQGTMNAQDSSSLHRSNTPLLNNFNRSDLNDNKKDYHMVKPDSEDASKAMQREVMLPRILTTYNNLNSYSEQLFESIFAAYQGQFGPPLPIKYIFDFLDEQAERISQERPNSQDINQSNLSHIWKSNCLPLRFWVNLIKNPDFLFDIEKPAAVDHTLTTIAQTMIDACSVSNSKKDHSVPKMIAQNQIESYRGWVQEYYEKIREIGYLPAKDFKDFLDDENQLHSGEFDTMAAVGQLWSYVTQYKNELYIALNADPDASKYKLAACLQRIEKGGQNMYSNSSAHAPNVHYGSQHALSYNQSQNASYNSYHSSSTLAHHGHHHHPPPPSHPPSHRPVPAPRQRPYRD